MKSNVDTGGVPMKLLEKACKDVHKLMVKKGFAPDGSVSVNADQFSDYCNVEIFGDGEVQLCLHYDRGPEYAGPLFGDMPELMCHVFVVFKVYKSGKVKVRRYECVLQWPSDDGFGGISSESFKKAYEKAAKKFNRNLDRVMKLVRA